MMSTHVLMVALETPPCLSAGVKRTVSFARYLRSRGWRVHLLSATENAYSTLDRSSINHLSNVPVARAWALDVSRHLAIKGRYPGFLSVPDKFSPWVISAVFSGALCVLRDRPDVIWSTFPVSSAHLVAGILSKIFNIPWVADFRDPAEFHYNLRGNSGRIYRSIDRFVVTNASALVFSTEQAKNRYRDSYENARADNTFVIENGFETSLLEKRPSEYEYQSTESEFVLLHSGSLYNGGRDPRGLISAIRIVGEAQKRLGMRVKLRLRGGGDVSRLRQMVEELEASSYIEVAPKIGYVEAVREMWVASALVVIQPEVFDLQIPGKVYEYIGTGKPILGIVGKEGATASLLSRIESTVVVGFSDVNQICEAIMRVSKMQARKVDVSKFDRIHRASELEGILTNLIQNGSSVN